MKNILTDRRSHELTIDSTLYEFCKGCKPTGIITSGYLGVAIWIIDGAGDECIAAFAHDEKYWNATKHFIYYTASGRAYIRKGGSRWYLDEALRCNL